MDPVDLRSDTVTHPTEEMYRQMAAAPLGDDVFGDDPTVNRLEQVAAQRLGKDAALFVPSGTMANTIAVGTLTRPGDEMLLTEDSHIYLYEAGGSARLWGVHPRPQKSIAGCLDANEIRKSIRPEDPHQPRTSLICLENSHNMQGGRVITAEQVAPITEVAGEFGLKMHLDGARIFHAEVALSTPAADIAAPFDTVSFCLSKGLSCPIGSLLCGSTDDIAEARHAVIAEEALRRVADLYAVEADRMTLTDNQGCWVLIEVDGEDAGPTLPQLEDLLMTGKNALAASLVLRSLAGETL